MCKDATGSVRSQWFLYTDERESLTSRMWTSAGYAWVHTHNFAAPVLDSSGETNCRAGFNFQENLLDWDTGSFLVSLIVAEQREAALTDHIARGLASATLLGVSPVALSGVRCGK